VDRTLENCNKIKLAFLDFGMQVFDMTKENFLNHPELDVFTFGRPPSSIDIMTKLKGLQFDNCYNNAVFFEEDGLKVRTIHIDDLITAKKATNRPKDINDLENLTS
jgi:hypothetical protein